MSDGGERNELVRRNHATHRVPPPQQRLDTDDVAGAQVGLRLVVQLQLVVLQRSAQANGINVLTWQPESGVRSAIVVKSYPGGYVLAGRSLQSVEQRETSLEQLLFIGGLATLALTFAAIFLTRLALVRPARQV